MSRRVLGKEASGEYGLCNVIERGTDVGGCSSFYLGWGFHFNVCIEGPKYIRQGAKANGEKVYLIPLHKLASHAWKVR